MVRTCILFSLTIWIVLGLCVFILHLSAQYFLLNFQCPHTQKDETDLRLCAEQRGFCLVKDGLIVRLDRRHTYYYQVQAQLHIVGVDYCDFVVWSKDDLFVERVVPDADLWSNVIPTVERFFRQCVLPEVLGGGQHQRATQNPSPVALTTIGRDHQSVITQGEPPSRPVPMPNPHQPVQLPVPTKTSALAGSGSKRRDGPMQPFGLGGTERRPRREQRRPQRLMDFVE